MQDHTTQTAGCATLDADRARLQRGGHTGIVALLDALDAARAAGERAAELVAEDGMTIRVSVAAAA